MPIIIDCLKRRPQLPGTSFRSKVPNLWRLVRPRRRVLEAGLALIALNRICGLVLPASTKVLIDDVATKHNAAVLLPLVAAILLAGILQGASSAALIQIVSKSAQCKIADLRRLLQAQIGRLPLAYHDSHKTGALVSRIMSDVESARNVIGTGFISLLGGIVSGLLALTLMITISPGLTAISVVFSTMVVFLVVKEMRIMRPMYRDQAKISAQVSGRLQESLAGIRVIKGYHAEKRESAVFSVNIDKLVDCSVKSLNVNAVMYFLSSMLMGVSGASVMYIGSQMILSDAMTLGSFLTFTALAAFLTAPVLQVANTCAQMSQALAGLERAQEILKLPVEDDDSERVIRVGEIRSGIAFDQVYFSYSPDAPVLFDITFEAASGTVTAFVGPSGAGKSTVTSLLAAFYNPDAGRILVDGIDLRHVALDSYRTQLGMVLQDPFLFEGTIRENVAFSSPEASEADILTACRHARVDEFAETLPDGYDTVVGERGVKLSGGQRQRISIARAMLANPRILILDEATSSLDSESEALIQDALSQLMEGRTTFVIAHRLSTIRQADQILVMEGGRIIERGTHDTLLSARGRYFDLYTTQHQGSGETEESLALLEAEFAPLPAHRSSGLAVMNAIHGGKI